MNCFQAELDNDHAILDKPLVQNKNSNTLILFAHGAGAAMDSEFMSNMAMGMANKGYWVLRFNFSYMQIRMQTGTKRPPDRAPKLLESFKYYLNLARNFAVNNNIKKIMLMGKSMGGRMAAIMAEHEKVSGVICLGYPFLPVNKTEPRLEPLQNALCSILVLQGERDRFGNKNQLVNWNVGNQTQVKWLKDGDHSFVPRKLSGQTYEQNIAVAINESDVFIASLKCQK